MSQENGPDSLILNPSMQLRVEFSASVRGQQPRQASLDPRKNPELSHFLLKAAAQQKWTPELQAMALPFLSELLELGIVIPASELPRTHDRQVLELLSSCEILNERGGDRSALALARGQLAREEFAVVRGLLSSSQVAALCLHFRGLREEGFFKLDRDQVAGGRSFLHNDPVSRLIQAQLLPLLCKITEEELKPSYTYLTTYFPGAELTRHTDRDQCTWNISLMIDTDPELSLENAWPIYFESGGSIGQARLAMGDAVFYRGTDIPHWRPRLPEGHFTTVLLAHFVSEDFADGLD